MPTVGEGDHAVRLREDAAGWRRVGGPRLTPDDPVLDGLTEQEAEDLLMSQWALVPAETTDNSADDDGVESWADWNEADWLDIGYEQRAEDVRAGRVDDHLDEVEACERSDTVLDAVEQRRDELAEE